MGVRKWDEFPLRFGAQVDRWNGGTFVSVRKFRLVVVIPLFYPLYAVC